MGIIKYIKYMLGFSGKNFSRKEKDQILEALKEYERHIMECRKMWDECDNMSQFLHQRLEKDTYTLLLVRYHNYTFYARKIEDTRIGIFLWSRYAYWSRQRAVEMLRVAIIND